MDLSKLNQLGDMISALGTVSASMQNNKEKIDTKAELNAFVSGWDAIQSKAKLEDADVYDMHTLEVRMKGELSDLLGVDLGTSAGVTPVQNEKGEYGFSSDEISLENMMSLLAPEDGLDIDKLREYNEIPVVSVDGAAQDIETMSSAGFSEELTEILMDEMPGAVRHITNSIKEGRAQVIEENIQRLRDQYGDDVDTVNIGAFMEELMAEGFFRD